MVTMTQVHYNTQHDAELLPAIVVSEAEHERLTNLAAAIEERAPEVAGVLRKEMERAQVVPADAIPADAVRMGSTVEFRSETGQVRRLTLVYPGEADLAAGRISILTPIGAALIGLSPGQSIAWTARDGRRHELTVLRVEQPDGSATRADS